MKYTQADIVYLAGFIDADGYFNICRSKSKDGRYNSYHTTIDIGSKNKAFVDYMSEKFEINFYKRFAKTQNVPYEFYQTQFSGEKLEHILELIHPYLIIKKRNCEIMIEFRKTYYFPKVRPGSKGGSLSPSEETNYIRGKLSDEIRSLSGAKGASKSKRHFLNREKIIKEPK